MWDSQTIGGRGENSPSNRSEPLIPHMLVVIATITLFLFQMVKLEDFLSTWFRKRIEANNWHAKYNQQWTWRKAQKYKNLGLNHLRTKCSFVRGQGGQRGMLTQVEETQALSVARQCVQEKLMRNTALTWQLISDITLKEITLRITTTRVARCVVE